MNAWCQWSRAAALIGFYSMENSEPWSRAMSSKFFVLKPYPINLSQTSKVEKQHNSGWAPNIFGRHIHKHSPQQGELEGGRNWLWHNIEVSDLTKLIKVMHNPKVTPDKSGDVSTPQLPFTVLAGPWFYANINCSTFFKPAMVSPYLYFSLFHSIYSSKSCVWTFLSSKLRQKHGTDCDKKSYKKLPRSQ